MPIGAVNNAPLWLPELDEQKAVGVILRLMDEVIVKLRRVRTGLLHDLLTRGLDPHGQLRDPIAHPEQFQDSPLGRIPQEWEVVTLGSICRPQQWPTISTSEMHSFGFPVFGANGQIGHYHSFNHEHSTVAITCRGATCGTIHVTPPCCYITGNAMALDDLDGDRVRLSVLAGFLRKRGLADCITGSAQPQIIRASLLSIHVPRPPLIEQDMATEILALHDAKAAAENSFLDKLHSLKSGLMTDLLTGRVRVPARSGASLAVDKS